MTPTDQHETVRAAFDRLFAEATHDSLGNDWNWSFFKLGVEWQVARATPPTESVATPFSQQRVAHLVGRLRDSSGGHINGLYDREAADMLEELAQLADSEGSRAVKYLRRARDAEARIAALEAPPTEPATPIDMVLHCPNCGMQHIDAPWTPKSPLTNDQINGVEPVWGNPPHRSHLCHGCGHIWRPADVPTNGVAGVKTKGKADSPVSARIAALEAAAVPDDDVLEALDLSPEQFRTEGGAINRAKLRAAIKHPADYLPPEHWLQAAAVPVEVVQALRELVAANDAHKEACREYGKTRPIGRFGAYEFPLPSVDSSGPPKLHAPAIDAAVSRLTGAWEGARAALATLQAAEPAEDHMTHAEWNRRYFPSGLTPVPDNAVPYTEPSAKKEPDHG